MTCLTGSVNGRVRIADGRLFTDLQRLLLLVRPCGEILGTRQVINMSDSLLSVRNVRVHNTASQDCSPPGFCCLYLSSALTYFQDTSSVIDKACLWARKWLDNW